MHKRNNRMTSLLLWLFTAILLMWRLWIPDYNAAMSGLPLKVTLIMEFVSILLFAAAAVIPQDLLGSVHRFLHRHKLNAAPVAVAVMLSMFLLSVVAKRVFAAEVPAEKLEGIFILLALLYDIFRGVSERGDIERYYWLYPLGCLALCVMSQLLLHDLTPGLMLSLPLVISNVHAFTLYGNSRITVKSVLKVILGIGIPFFSVLWVLFYQVFKTATEEKLVYNSSEGYERYLEMAGSYAYVFMAVFAVMFIFGGILTLSVGQRKSMKQLHCSAIALSSCVAFLLSVLHFAPMILGVWRSHYVLPCSSALSAIIPALIANSLLHSTAEDKKHATGACKG